MIKLEHPFSRTRTRKAPARGSPRFQTGHVADFVQGVGRHAGTGIRARPIIRCTDKAIIGVRTSSFYPTRHQHRKRAHPRDARRGGLHHHLIRQGTRTRVGSCSNPANARSSSFCVAHRLRLQRHQSLPRLRFARRHDPRRIARDVDHKTAVKKYIKQS